MKKILILLISLLSFNTYSGELKVVSYNIAKGLFLKKTIGKKVFIKKFHRSKKLKNTSILGIQEICVNNQNQIDLVSKIFKKNIVYKYLDTESHQERTSCQKGLGIFSEYPIVKNGTIRLPKVGSNRIAIWADIQVDQNKIIRVYNLHLSNRAGKNYWPVKGRAQQGIVVLDHIKALLESTSDRSIIVLGDFNSLNKLYNPWKLELNIKNFQTLLNPTIKKFTPTMIIPYKTDWIFYKNINLKQSKISRFILSDHFPIMAIFNF